VRVAAGCVKQRDFQFADAFDAAVEHVAAHHRRYAGRRSGKDQVARRQAHVS
jgi:hypothetical protein